MVSEGSTNLDQEYGVNNLAFNWTKIITYSIKFAIENGLRFNFIFKREKKRGKGFYESEIKYLKKYLNPKISNTCLKIAIIKIIVIFHHMTQFLKQMF